MEIIDAAQSILPLLSGVFAVLSGLILLINRVRSLFYKKDSDKDKSLKIFALLLVAVIAFVINDARVYAIAMFIVATLFVKPDFLLKLAAIIWHSEPGVFPHLSDAIPPGPQEVQKDLEREVKEDLETEKKISQLNGLKKPKEKFKDAVKKAKSFEEAVLRALWISGFFKGYTVKQQVRLIIDRRVFLLDGLVRGLNSDIIIEVKYLPASSVIFKAIDQLKLYMGEYKKLLDSIGEKKRIYGLLVVPSGALEFAHDFISPDIAILKYDEKRDKFINETVIDNWLEI